MLDHLFAHPNVAPFISKRLIKHLVTSNPSSSYVVRISSVFNDNGSWVKGVYNLGRIGSIFGQSPLFGQAPLRAKSVFNFYDDSFVPSDSYFSMQRLLSPELQLFTDQFMVDFNNFIFSFIQTFEKNIITKFPNNPQTLEEYASSKDYISKYTMLIDFDNELAILE